MSAGAWCPFGDEAVADAADGEEVARARGLVLDVLAQTHDEVVDGARVGVVPQAPDLFEQGLARDDLARAADEGAQQVGLHQREAPRAVPRAQLTRRHS